MTAARLANMFIERGGSTSDLTHMKLQKLIFYADGWYSAFHDTKMVSESPQVWRYGPVYQSLYNLLSGRRNDPIRSLVTVSPFEPINEPSLPEDAATVVKWIFERYGSYSAVRLSDMTHAPGTPWHSIAVQYGFNVPFNLEIPDDLIQSYFKGLAREEGLIGN